MKIVFIFLCYLYFSAAEAQNFINYAALKTGLSLREQPNTSSKVLQKIGYGQKLELLKDTGESIKIVTEGFNGFWQKVKYNNQAGYVVSSYLFSVAPPKPTIKNVKDYLAQLSVVAGPVVTVKKGNGETMGDYYSELKKQLYKNGAEWHEFNGYESGTEIYFLPNFSIEQAFLLMRIIGQYATEVGEKDTFPEKNSKVKLNRGEKTTTVERLKSYDGVTPGPISKIIIETEEGPVSTLEIFLIDGQAVICWGSGV
jgi:hypothetical protein